MNTKKMVLDAWKSGEAITAPVKLAKTVISTAIQPIKTKKAQDEMIKKHVDTKVEKDMRTWNPMKKTTNNMISAKKELDKKIKKDLGKKGIY
ncbi:MAG: hypothetical protein WC938_03535 [Candidatus Paceibacterota bacterium]|jgi:hypothetical protein